MLDPAGAEVEANLAIASGVAILAVIALPSNGKRNFQSINYDWIRHDEEKQLSKVNSTLRLPRVILHLIHPLTLEAEVGTPKTRGQLTYILSTLTNGTLNVFCEKSENLLGGWTIQ
jgi:hypothetical protein